MTTRRSDPFLLNYDANDLETATEFLSNWLPFLTRGLCRRCSRKLSDRIRCLHPGTDVDVGVVKQADDFTVPGPKDSDVNECSESQNDCDTHSVGSGNDSGVINDKADTNSLGSWQDAAEVTPSSSETYTSYVPTETRSVKMSWADMAQEDELEAEGENEVSSSQLVKENGSSGQGIDVDESKPKTELPREQRELRRFRDVKRKKEFICFERVNGKYVNILDGLELHTGVFSAAEQKRIVSVVEEFQEMGKNGELTDRTYTAPQKWMKGKGRVTLQFGCCYNYATDRKGNPPGILQNSTVDPFPPIFKVMIRRLVRWHVMPPSCVPDSCIVNIYDEGDCIPPHIDSHDFVRPFCTISFLSECNIVFGTSLKVLDAGVFAGAVAIPLPVGSVLVLNGKGADVAKHCVPSVPTKRISITFRRMDETKRPVGYVPEPDLQGIQPLFGEEDQSKKLVSLEKQEYHREENWYKGNGPRERSLDSSKPRQSLEKQADHREGSKYKRNGFRERSSNSSKPRQSLEKQADHREGNNYKGNGSSERSSDSSKPRQSLEKQADHREGNKYKGDGSRESSDSSIPRQSLENQADHRVESWYTGDGSRERSSEYRYPIRTRPGPMNRRN